MSTRPSGAQLPTVPVGLSTASVYPESTSVAFETAAALGYDGVEVMVWTDPVSQDVDALRRLSDYHSMPVLSIHAPCLLLTQRVWSPDPWERLTRSQHVAEALGASTVVVHPAFRWQRDYAKQLSTGLRRMAAETEVTFAVENMFPLRARGKEFSMYSPDWDVISGDYDCFTLDISHTAVSRSDAVEMAALMGDRLSHVHLGDGTGLGRDEHLVPGRGTQPCGPVLERLATDRFTGAVVVEVSTRSAVSHADRESDLGEALAFARMHLAAQPVP